MRVLSSPPETIVFPSGEKSTDLIQSLWAFSFSVLSSKVSASEAEGCESKKGGRLERRRFRT